MKKLHLRAKGTIHNNTELTGSEHGIQIMAWKTPFFKLAGCITTYPQI